MTTILNQKAFAWVVTAAFVLASSAHADRPKPSHGGGGGHSQPAPRPSSPPSRPSTPPSRPSTPPTPPRQQPTQRPSQQPTQRPSQQPTQRPTQQPTQQQHNNQPHTNNQQPQQRPNNNQNHTNNQQPQQRPNNNQNHTNNQQPQQRPNNNQPTQNHPRTPTNDGGYIENRGNHVVKYRADGTKEYMKSDSRTVQYRRDGSKAQETRGKTVTTYHQDGSHSVSVGGRPKYTETRVQSTHGETHIQRTYIRENNVTVVRNYRTYVYGGYSYYTYVPSMIYDPWYYDYLYRPWGSPVAYTWSWRFDPWYGYYGYYYRPYVHYYSPAYWITDFLIADYLSGEYRALQSARQDAAQAAEDARQAAAQARAISQQSQPAQVQLTEEIKDQIKQQVEEAIRAHERKETLPLQAATRDLRHVFVVSDDLDATIESSGQACSLTSGDLIRLREVPEESAVAAKMVVLTAKRGNCPAGSAILVSLRDLQQFQNDFVEKVEDGMDKMKKDVVGR